MVFSSIPFLFFFLPLCLILYYLVPFKVKNYILLVFSLVFYAWGEPVYILLMLFETLSDYTLGRFMDKAADGSFQRKLCLALSVIIDLSVLGFFKYADFLIESVNAFAGTSFTPLGLGLPIGISFFTFQTMSYTIDLYKKEVAVEKNYFYYLTYVSMFPQLIAGPIVRFSTVNEELHERKIDFEGFIQGGLRFLQGLFKKVLLANTIGSLWEVIKAAAFASSGELSVVSAWLGAMCFTLQLYFDFGAYSDMAIGMGRMLGFHYLENFNYPLSAVSVTDFWRRWHISLSTWFRDYVYIPLGGNRHGELKQLRNMFVVWFLTGLWHGAAWNFILWGLFYGVLLALEKNVWGKALGKLPAVLQHLYAMFIYVTGFVIFVFDDMGQLGHYLRIMFGMSGAPVVNADILWYLRNNFLILILGCIISFPVYPWLRGKLRSAAKGNGGLSEMITRETFITILRSSFYIILFFLTTAYLVNDTYNPFLYFRF